MTNNVHALFMFAKNSYEGVEVDTTARGGVWSGLSPFKLNALRYGSKTFENLWQFSKVYHEFLGADSLPANSWYEWRYDGFREPRAVRYPLGKGRVPAYSFWRGEKLGYVEARKRVYAPIYAELVSETESFKRLCSLYESLQADGRHLVLRDYDAYDHGKLGMTLPDVINNPNRKCGHAFVLVMILTGCLEDCLK